MMVLIIGFTCPSTSHFKFITKCDKCYCKLRQLILLQRAMVCYYKVRQLLQSATILLQSATEHTCVKAVVRQGKDDLESCAYFWKFSSYVPVISALFAVLRRNFMVVQPLHAVPSNTTVILPCKPPHGEPRPTITWYKNGEPFSPERGRQVIFAAKNTVKLVIKHVSANDSGEYRCVAMNMAAHREGPILRLEVRGWSVQFRFFFVRSWQQTLRSSYVRKPKSVLDSGFHIVDSGLLSVELGSRIVQFRIPWAVLQIPKSKIPDSTSKIFGASGIGIPLY